MVKNETVKKGETNMAYPFKPLSTEKLKNYFKKMIETNCNNQETDQCHEQASQKNIKKQTVLSCTDIEHLDTARDKFLSPI